MEQEMLKHKLDDYLLANQAQYIQWGDTLQMMPESGFCEKRTTAFVMDRLKKMELDSLEKLPVSGCIGRVKGRGAGKTVAVMAEIDAAYCAQHALADPKTGMAHVCGHQCQITMMLATADAMLRTGAARELPGEIVFIAVPAEEMVADEVYQKLKAGGSVVYRSGKQELIRQGYLKEVDAVLTIHSATDQQPVIGTIGLQTSCNGFATVRSAFYGRAAHTAENPEQGINTLSTAVLAINSLQALRETFDAKECIRLSYLLAKGGESLSTVPDITELSVQVRAKHVEKLDQLVDRVKTIMKDCAHMMGAQADINVEMGYLPFYGDRKLMTIAEKNANGLGFKVVFSEHGSYCTDLGDISQIFPTLQFSAGGFKGSFHSAEFELVDKQEAYVVPARVMASTLVDVLKISTEQEIVKQCNMTKA